MRAWSADTSRSSGRMDDQGWRLAKREFARGHEIFERAPGEPFDLRRHDAIRSRADIEQAGKVLEYRRHRARRRDQHETLGGERRNAVDGAGDRIGGDRPAEGMADDCRERPEPLADDARGVERMQHGEAPARRMAVARQVERDDAVAGIAVALDQRLHILGARGPAMDHQHGAQPFPAGQRPELERGDVAGARGQAMLARFGKQSGGAIDGLALALAELVGIGRPAEQLEGDAGPSSDGATCSPAPNSVLMTL